MIFNNNYIIEFETGGFHARKIRKICKQFKILDPSFQWLETPTGWFGFSYHYKLIGSHKTLSAIEQAIENLIIGWVPLS